MVQNLHIDRKAALRQCRKSALNSKGEKMMIKPQWAVKKKLSLKGA